MLLFFLLSLSFLVVSPRPQPNTLGGAALDPLSALPLMVWAVGNLSTLTDPPSLLEAAVALEKLAALESLLRRHSAAASSLEKALQKRLLANKNALSVSDLISFYAGITKEHQSARQYKAARRSLTAARRVAGTIGNNPAVDAVLLFMDAALLDCMGEGAAALVAYDEGLSVRGGPMRSASEAIALLEHLWHAASGPPRPKNKTYREKIYTRQRSVSAALVRTGPWDRVDQLPLNYEPNLAAAPWHAFDGPHSLWSHVTAPVAALLAAAAPALRAEFLTLKASGSLLEENECIHTGGGVGANWRWFATNGFWTLRDIDGCALATPAACALLRSVTTVSPTLRVLRSGYSSIDGKVTLRPHCGRTNAQLKFHLGLIVPRNNGGAPCARLTVGNETRAWEEGGVLFFDDSFLHSVKHDCDEERVIFQLVITHPDSVAKASRQESTSSREEGSL